MLSPTQRWIKEHGKMAALGVFLSIAVIWLASRPPVETITLRKDEWVCNQKEQKQRRTWDQPTKNWKYSTYSYCRQYTRID